MNLLKENLTTDNMNKSLDFSIFHLAQYLLLLFCAIFKSTDVSGTLSMCGISLPVCLIKKNLRPALSEK